MSPYEDGNSLHQSGKHWIRVLFKKEIKDVSKQRWTLHYSRLIVPLQSKFMAVFMRTHETIRPTEALFPLELRPASPPCRRKGTKHPGIAQGFSRCWSSCFRDLLCVTSLLLICAVRVRAPCHLWRMLQVGGRSQREMFRKGTTPDIFRLPAMSTLSIIWMIIWHLYCK